MRLQQLNQTVEVMRRIPYGFRKSKWLNYLVKTEQSLGVIFVMQLRRVKLILKPCVQILHISKSLRGNTFKGKIPTRATRGLIAALTVVFAHFIRENNPFEEEKRGRIGERRV